MGGTHWISSLAAVAGDELLRWSNSRSVLTLRASRPPEILDAGYETFQKRSADDRPGRQVSVLRKILYPCRPLGGVERIAFDSSGGFPAFDRKTRIQLLPVSARSGLRQALLNLTDDRKPRSDVPHSCGTLYTLEYNQQARAKQHGNEIRNAVQAGEHRVQRIRIKLWSGKPAGSNVGERRRDFRFCNEPALQLCSVSFRTKHPRGVSLGCIVGGLRGLRARRSRPGNRPQQAEWFGMKASVTDQPRETGVGFKDKNPSFGLEDSVKL